jgi:hypothetical protein
MSIPFWDDVSTFRDANGLVRSSAEGPLYAPNPWDNVWVNWQQLPGICKASGLPTIGIDKKKSNGRNGLTLTVNGYLPGPIEIESLVWTPEQWDKWQEIIPFIWQKPTSAKMKASDLAVMVSTPALDFLGIGLLVPIGITPPERGSIPQSMTIKLKSLEYVDAKIVNLKTAKPAAKDVPIVRQYRRQNAPESPSKTGNGLTGPTTSHLGGAE